MTSLINLKVSVDMDDSGLQKGAASADAAVGKMAESVKNGSAKVKAAADEIGGGLRGAQKLLAEAGDQGLKYGDILSKVAQQEIASANAQAGAVRGLAAILRSVAAEKQQAVRQGDALIEQYKREFDVQNDLTAAAAKLKTAEAELTQSRKLAADEAKKLMRDEATDAKQNAQIITQAKKDELNASREALKAEQVLSQERVRNIGQELRAYNDYLKQKLAADKEISASAKTTNAEMLAFAKEKRAAYSADLADTRTFTAEYRQGQKDIQAETKATSVVQRESAQVLRDTLAQKKGFLQADHALEMQIKQDESAANLVVIAAQRGALDALVQERQANIALRDAEKQATEQRMNDARQTAEQERVMMASLNALRAAKLEQSMADAHNRASQEGVNSATGAAVPLIQRLGQSFTTAGKAAGSFVSAIKQIKPYLDQVATEKAGTFGPFQAGATAVERLDTLLLTLTKTATQAGASVAKIFSGGVATAINEETKGLLQQVDAVVHLGTAAVKTAEALKNLAGAGANIAKAGANAIGGAYDTMVGNNGSAQSAAASAQAAQAMTQLKAAAAAALGALKQVGAAIADQGRVLGTFAAAGIHAAQSLVEFGAKAASAAVNVSKVVLDSTVGTMLRFTAAVGAAVGKLAELGGSALSAAKNMAMIGPNIVGHIGNIVQAAYNGINAFRRLEYGFVAISQAIKGVTGDATALDNEIHNIATIAQGGLNMDAMFNSINEIRSRIPAVAADIANEIYDIYSTIDNVTQNTATFMAEQFSRGATAALTSTQSFGTSIMGLMNTYGQKIGDLNHDMDVFFNTVNRGVITGSQLSATLGPVAQAAKQAGVNINELGGFIAGVTREGGSAANNMTALKNVFDRMTTAAATAEFKKLGIATFDAKGNARDAIDVFTDLKAKLSTLNKEGQDDAMNKLFTNVRGKRGAEVVLSQLDEFKKATKENETQSGSAAKAYEIMMKSFQNQWTLLANNVKTAISNIVHAIEPVLAPVLNNISSKIRSMEPGIQRFATALAAGIAKDLPIVEAIIGNTVKTAEKLFSLFELGASRAAQGFAPLKAALADLEKHLSGMGASSGAQNLAYGLGRAFGEATKVVAAVIVKLDEIVPKVAAFIQTFAKSQTAATAIGLIGTALGYIKADIIDAAKWADSFLNAFAKANGASSGLNMMKTVLDEIQARVRQIGTLLGQAIEQAGPPLIKFAVALSKAFNDVLKVMGPPIIQALAAVATQISNLANNLLPRLVGLINQFGPTVVSIFQSVTSTVVKLAGDIATMLLPVITRIGQWVQDHRGEIKKFFSDIGDIVRNVFGTVVIPLLNKFIDLWTGTIWPALSSTLKTLKDLFSQYGDQIKTVTGILFNFVTIAVGPAVEILKHLVEAIKVAIDAFALLVSAVQTATSFISSGFNSADKSYQENVKNMVTANDRLVKSLKDLGDSSTKEFDRMSSDSTTDFSTVGKNFGGLVDTIHQGAIAIAQNIDNGILNPLRNVEFLHINSNPLSGFIQNLWNDAASAVGAVNSIIGALGKLGAAGPMASLNLNPFGTATHLTRNQLANQENNGDGTDIVGNDQALNNMLDAFNQKYPAYDPNTGGSSDPTDSGSDPGPGGGPSGGGGGGGGGGGSKVDPAKQLLDQAKLMAEAADALMKLDGFVAPLKASTDRFFKAIKEIADQFAALAASYSEATVTKMAGVSDAISKIVDVLDKGLTAFDHLNQSAPVGAGKLKEFGGEILSLIKTFQDSAAGMDVAAFVKIIQYATVAGEVGAAVSTASDAMNKLRNFAALTQSAIHNFSNSLLVVMQVMHDTSAMFDGVGLGGITRYVATATLIADLVEKATSAFDKLRNYGTLATADIQHFSNNVLTMALSFQGASYYFDSIGLTGATKYADTATKIMDAADKAVTLFDKMRQYSVLSVTSIQAFSNNVLTFVQSFQSASYIFEQQGLDGAGHYSDTALKIMDVVAKGLAAFDAMRRYSRLGVAIIQDFSNDILTFGLAFESASYKFDATGLAGTNAYSDTLLKVVDAVSKGVDALTKLTGYSRPTKSLMNQFVADLRAVAADFENLSRAFNPTTLASTAGFADMAAKVVDTVSKGVDAFLKLDGYSAVGRAALAAFKADMNLMVRDFAEISTHYSPEMLTQTTALATTFNAVATGIGPAVDGLAKIGSYFAVRPNPGQIDAFMSDVKLVIEKVKAMTAYLGATATTEVENLGKALTAVFDGLDKALAFFIQLATGGASESVQTSSGGGGGSRPRMVRGIPAGRVGGGRGRGRSSGGPRTTDRATIGADVPADLAIAQERMADFVAAIKATVKAVATMSAEALKDLGNGNTGAGKKVFASAVSFATEMGTMFDGLKKALDLFIGFGPQPNSQETAMGTALAGADNLIKGMGTLMGRIVTMTGILKANTGNAALFRTAAQNWAAAVVAGMQAIVSAATMIAGIGKTPGSLSIGPNLPAQPAGGQAASSLASPNRSLLGAFSSGPSLGGGRQNASSGGFTMGDVIVHVDGYAAKDDRQMADLVGAAVKKELLAVTRQMASNKAFGY